MDNPNLQIVCPCLCAGRVKELEDKLTQLEEKLEQLRNEDR